MTKQELIKGIKDIIDTAICFGSFSDKITLRYSRNRALGGYADQIHSLYKEAGYVKLSDDQSLPKNYLATEDTHAFGKTYYDAQRDMLKVVDGKAFRKVELEVKDG